MSPSSIRKFIRWIAQSRSIRLSSDGVRFVLLSVGIGVASINTGNNLLYLLFAMMLSLIVISGILSERCFKHVEVSRRLPPVLFANQPVTAAFVITNRSSRFPIFSLHVMDVLGGTAVERGVHVLHLLPKAVTMQYYPLLVKRRGVYVLDGFRLLTRFPFGLFVKATTMPMRSEIMVYPEVQSLPVNLLNDLSIVGHDDPLPQRGQGTALHNLRLYHPGDDSRAIHWKTTARKSLLIVRETEAEDQRRVGIVLETEIPSLGVDHRDLFEKAVSLAASLAVLFTEQAYEIRFMVGEQQLAYETGGAHLARMLSMLAVCEPTVEPRVPRRFHRQVAHHNELTIHVLACPDRNGGKSHHGASRILLASEFM